MSALGKLRCNAELSAECPEWAGTNVALFLL